MRRAGVRMARGVCPACQRFVAVRADGLLSLHRNAPRDSRGRPPTCEASFTKPQGRCVAGLGWPV